MKSLLSRLVLALRGRAPAGEASFARALEHALQHRPVTLSVASLEKLLERQTDVRKTAAPDDPETDHLIRIH